MGAYCSIHNDTEDETVLVYVGANPKVVKPLLWTLSGAATMLSGAAAWGIVNATVLEMAISQYTVVITASTLASATGGLVSLSNWALETLQNKIVADLAKGGYAKILPGQTHTTGPVPISLNMRAWIIRFRRERDAIIVCRSNASVWAGGSRGTIANYNVLDKRFFKKWRIETIPVEFDFVCDDVNKERECGDDGGEGYSVIHSKNEFSFVPETDSNWVRVERDWENR